MLREGACGVFDNGVCGRWNCKKEGNVALSKRFGIQSFREMGPFRLLFSWGCLRVWGLYSSLIMVFEASIITNSKKICCLFDVIFIWMLVLLSCLVLQQTYHWLKEETYTFFTGYCFFLNLSSFVSCKRVLTVFVWIFVSLIIRTVKWYDDGLSWNREYFSF